MAELRTPTLAQPRGVDSLDAILDALAERGEVTRGSLPKHRWRWKVKSLGMATGSAGTLLDEIRGDR